MTTTKRTTTTATTSTTTTTTTTSTTTITTSTTTPTTTTTTSPTTTTAAKRIKNIDEIITAQNVLEKKVEAEISGDIDQLKADLKMLLVFNDNIQEASHQIVKEATKAKVETFFKSVSSSLNMLTFKKAKESAENNEDVQVEPNSKEDMEKIEAADMKKKEEDVKMATSILNITKDISKGLAATVEVGGTMEIQLEDISMAVMKKRLDSNSQVGQSSVWQSEELSVELPGDHCCKATPSTSLQQSKVLKKKARHRYFHFRPIVHCRGRLQHHSRVHFLQQPGRDDDQDGRDLQPGSQRQRDWS